MRDQSLRRPREVSAGSDRSVGLDSRELLAFQAPYLIDRLVKNRTADDEQDALALFDAVKRFMILASCDDMVSWSMYSLRVDEAWHQFILFTDVYKAFCDRFFGSYFSHIPSNAPTGDDASAQEPSTFLGFQARYREVFGQPLPDVWFDERSITPWRRVLNVHAGTWAVSDGGETVALIAGDGRRMLSMRSFAGEALAFIAQTGAFYVRELPGGLTDAERVCLVSALVSCKLLRVAP